MKFGAWNVRILYRAGSLSVTAGLLARWKLDLLSVQEVRWEKRGMVRGTDCNFSVEKKMKIINWKQNSLYIAE